MTELPPPLPARSPLSGSALRDLAFRPTTYFQTVTMDRGKYWLGALWLLGVASTLGQVDKNLMRADLGQPRAGWDALGPIVMGSWWSFWVFLLGVGVAAAAMHWYVGGWWYNLRIRWAGAPAHDKRTGRLVFVFARLVVAAPSVAYAVIATALYEDYLAAWRAEELWSTVLLLFPFWSVVVSYRGVRASFPVKVGRARVWFLLLPFAVYVIAYGVIGLAYTLLTDSSIGVAA